MKIKPETLWVEVGALLFVASVANGCGGPTDSEGVGTDPPPVETRSAAATVGCRTGFEHGNSASQQTFIVTVGCTVSPGFHRTTATASNIRDGACSISGWLDRNDPHSGQINVNVTNAGGWGSGFCTVTVFQDPDPNPTCAHSLCTTGVALASSCSAGAATVCNFDGFCCVNRWDSICVSEVASLGVSCGG